MTKSKKSTGTARKSVPTQSARRKKSTRSDPYLQKIGEHWSIICKAYDDFKEKKPILEFELPRGIIYAWAADEYIDSISLRTRDTARQQYENAVANDRFVLFIKDTAKEVLKSYTLSLKD